MAKDTERLYYQGNANLRGENVSYEYTQEQLDEILRCKEDVLYFVRNYCKIISLDNGLVHFETYPFQDMMIEKMHESTRVITKWPRQAGKTTTTAAYLCHYAVFNSEKTIAILANKGAAAREVLDRIKLMYENLPYWMQHGVLEWNKGSIKLENHSKIITGATSSSSIRGQSISVLYVDEFAFIPPNLFNEFFTSVYPTIASSKSSKVLLSSTPYGMNHFYKMWTEAVEGLNGYEHLEIKWYDVPGRDEEYKERTIAEVGQERWEQEYEAEFLGSSGTLVNGKALKLLTFKKPLVSQFGSRFNVYQQPIDGHKYIAICDVSEGIGGDSSTIQVIDLTEIPYKQVATFEDNTVKTNVFHEAIAKIATHYNDALVIVESNSMGTEVNHNLNFDTEYENIFYNNKDFGLKTTKLTKRLGCSHLKAMIEDGKLVLCDFNTINQLSKFIRRKNSYAADEGEHDDLIMPLVMFAYFMSQDNMVEMWLDLEDVSSELQKKKLQQIEEDLLPVGFSYDGIDFIDYENF